MDKDGIKILYSPPLISYDGWMDVANNIISAIFYNPIILIIWIF